MKRTCCVALLILAVAVVSFAQQPVKSDPATPEQITKMFQLLNIDAQMAATSAGMKQQMIAMTLEDVKKRKPDAPPAMLTEVSEAYGEMFTEMFKTFSGKMLMDVIGPVYQKHLTRAEADAVIAFYSSPEGKSFLEKMPAISIAAMQAMMPRMQEQLEPLGAKFKVRLDEIMAKYEPEGHQH